MARTARGVVEARRKAGERIGMIRIKQFRPFPRDEIIKAVGAAKRIGVLDRNHSPGSGGIFWQEVATTLGGGSGLILQDYLIGLGGGDVTPKIIEEVLDDLAGRDESGEPIWKEVAA